MKIAFCGLSFSGKSTVFKALAGKKVQPKTSASGKVHLNIGTLELKDERLKKLAAMLNSEKVVYPQVSLVDMLYSGEGGGAKGIDTAHIREFEALALVIGAFSSKDPVADMNNIETEFILADLQVVQNRIERIKKDKKAQAPKDEDPEMELLNRCRKGLEEEKPVSELGLSREELKVLAGFQLLTLKPAIIIANVSEEQLNKKQWQDIEKKAREKKHTFLAFCAKLEAEIEDLPETEWPEFMREMGLASLTRDSFIQLCFQALERIVFFTVVGKEARAWPILQGMTALEAAGSVHTDMQRGFIRAEVINYRDFVQCGSFTQAKDKGLLRLEGKEYVVCDGDIINFKFSV